MKFLSIDAKRLASCGSCLAMSPPEKTASMYVQAACTPSHISTISDTTDSLVIHVSTSSLKGAL